MNRYTGTSPLNSATVTGHACNLAAEENNRGTQLVMVMSSPQPLPNRIGMELSQLLTILHAMAH